MTAAYIITRTYSTDDFIGEVDLWDIDVDVLETVLPDLEYLFD